MLQHLLSIYFERNMDNKIEKHTKSLFKINKSKLFKHIYTKMCSCVYVFYFPQHMTSLIILFTEMSIQYAFNNYLKAVMIFKFV